MIEDTDYYAILGVPQSATDETIRKVFSGLLSQFPTDGAEKNDPAYQRILQAYEVLSDPDRRSIYNSLVAETAVSALTITIQASQDQLQLSESEQLIYLLVNVVPPDTTEKSQRPLNLSLVIDRSTSMKGSRLDHVKAALETLIDKLAPDDIISIISFSDRAEVVVPSQPVNNKRQLFAKIHSIFTSGGTEIYQGLLAGTQELHKVSLPQHTNHLILLTDGYTYGDADKCLYLAQQATQQNIDYSAFGIGAEWNDQFLDQLVAPSGGQSQYIETPTKIIDHLQQRIKGLGSIYARNLHLSSELPKNIMPKFGFKLSPFAQPLTLGEQEIKLGNVEGRRPLSFLLELGVAPHAIAARINIPLNFTADLPNQPKHTFNTQHQITILENVPPSTPPPAIIKAVRLLNMYRMNEKVMDDVEAGQLDAATRRMRHLSTRLLEAGQTKLAQQAHLEGERLAAMGDLSPEGRKKLKYGTRALIGQTIATMDLDIE